METKEAAEIASGIRVLDSNLFTIMLLTAVMAAAAILSVMMLGRIADALEHAYPPKVVERP